MNLNIHSQRHILIVDIIVLVILPDRMMIRPKNINDINDVSKLIFSRENPERKTASKQSRRDRESPQLRLSFRVDQVSLVSPNRLNGEIEISSILRATVFSTSLFASVTRNLLKKSSEIYRNFQVVQTLSLFNSILSIPGPYTWLISAVLKLKKKLLIIALITYIGGRICRHKLALGTQRAIT